MTRRGRKRNVTASRYPSGGVKHREPREREEEAALVAKLGRLNSLPDLLNEIGRPEWGTELGKLYAKGNILKPEMEAGKQWAELVWKHRRIVMGQSGQPNISKGERIAGGERVYAQSLVDRIAKQYDKAYCAVVESSRDGVRILRAANKLCVDNERLFYDELLLARKALKIWAEHFGC